MEAGARDGSRTERGGAGDGAGAGARAEAAGAGAGPGPGPGPEESAPVVKKKYLQAGIPKGVDRRLLGPGARGVYNTGRAVQIDPIETPG